MRKVLSLVVTLAVIGLIGFTAGCKKKEEAPKMEQPAPAAPAQPAQPAPEAANQTGAPQQAPAEQPAEKK